jgi:uncharacterized membrane protein
VWAFFVLALAIKVATLVWSAVRLPARVATHFGISGAADDWSSRSAYLAFSVVISAVVVLGIPAIGLAAARGSGAALSVPHKDYWLRPENLPELRRRLTDDLLILGAITGLFMAWLDILVVRANEAAVPTLGNSFWVALGIYLVVVVGWSVWMMTKRYAVPAR